MKKQPGFFLVMLILIASIALGIDSATINMAEKTPISKELRQDAPQTADLVSHDPIYIYDDDLLEFYASSGEGSKISPYIIENWNITTSSTHGIKVTSTTKYFIIRNCWITTLGYIYHSICLEYVAPRTAQLYNNTCVESSIGIYIFYCDGVIIENNICNFNTYDGIGITDSNYVVVRDNLCNYNDCGIGIDISLVNGVLENNICMKNYYGIQMFGSLNSVFTKNYIANNTHGFQFYTTEQYWCNQSEFTWNKFLYNEYQGLELNGLFYYQNEIHHNWFIDNYIGYPQAMDGGGSNHFEMNYWNTWTGPDIDNNGIVDVPYILDSPVGNADYKPLTVLYEPGIYISHNPIYIDGNTDFNDTAVLEGWFGNGSAFNPFIIQQYQISSSDYAITIINTNYSFILQNCECVGGLYLSLVSNGSVINNHFKEIAYPTIGMAIFESTNCNFSRNIIQNASGLGAQISGGILLRIVENLFQDIAYGVQFSDCNDSLFNFNNIVRTSYGYYGLEVNVPISTIVMYNNYVDIGSVAAGGSEIYSISGFETNQGYNWYSSSFSPDCDLDSDGYMDSPHYIGGGYYDYYPLASATTMSLPFIQNPTGGFIVSGNIMITWISSADLWNQPIIYSLYYSYEGYGWTYLADGLTPPSFIWDTATVADGYYRLMVMAKSTNGIGVQYVMEPFLIKNTIHELLPPYVTFPNGWETVAGTLTITWNAASDSWGDSILYTVYYWNGSNGVWDYIGQTYSTYLEWYTYGTIPYRTDYLIRVVAECTQGLITEDTSDNYFTVQNVDHSISPPQVLYPNGGETVSNSVQITWIPSSDTLGHNIFYDIYYWGGSSWIYISTTSETYIFWDTLSVPNGNWHQIRVLSRCSDGMTVDDISDYSFTVQNNAHSLDSLHIVFPNGGELISGSCDITWNGAVDSFGHMITYTVYFTSDISGGWVLIGSTSETHLFWNIPSSLPGRTDYRIKVVASCTGGINIEDISEGSFTIKSNESTTSTSSSSSSGTMSNEENPFPTISGYDTYLVGLSFLLIAGVYIYLFKKYHC